MTQKQRAALLAELDKINALLAENAVSKTVAKKAKNKATRKASMKLVVEDCTKYAGYKVIVNTMDLIHMAEFRRLFVDSKTKVRIGKSKARWDKMLRCYRVREDVLAKAGF